MFSSWLQVSSSVGLVGESQRKADNLSWAIFIAVGRDRSCSSSRLGEAIGVGGGGELTRRGGWRTKRPRGKVGLLGVGEFEWVGEGEGEGMTLSYAPGVSLISAMSAGRFLVVGVSCRAMSRCDRWRATWVLGLSSRCLFGGMTAGAKPEYVSSEEGAQLLLTVCTASLHTQAAWTRQPGTLHFTKHSALQMSR